MIKNEIEKKGQKLYIPCVPTRVPSLLFFIFSLTKIDKFVFDSFNLEDLIALKKYKNRKFFSKLFLTEQKQFKVIFSLFLMISCKFGKIKIIFLFLSLLVKTMHLKCKALTFTNIYYFVRKLMFMEHRKSSNTINNLQVHLVRVTKYHYSVLCGDIQLRCSDILR